MAFITAESSKGRFGAQLLPEDVGIGLHAKRENKSKVIGLSLCVTFPRTLVKDLGWAAGITRIAVQFGIGEDHGVIMLSPCSNGVLLSTSKHSETKPLIQKSVGNLKGITITSDPFMAQVCGWEIEGDSLLLFPKNLSYKNTTRRRQPHDSF